MVYILITEIKGANQSWYSNHNVETWLSHIRLTKWITFQSYILSYKTWLSSENTSNQLIGFSNNSDAVNFKNQYENSIDGAMKKRWAELNKIKYSWKFIHN